MTLPVIIALAGCAGTGSGSASGVPHSASASASAGSSAIIGTNARDLVRMFGTPRLDIRDPTARKLQFANGRCILDAYLYSSSGKRDPAVTYVEARDPDGRMIDPDACARLLRD